MISQDFAIRFLFFFHDKHRAPSTVAINGVALADPLQYSFKSEPHLVILIGCGYFAQCPPPQPERPCWSLRKVLQYHALDEISNATPSLVAMG